MADLSPNPRWKYFKCFLYAGLVSSAFGELTLDNLHGSAYTEMGHLVEGNFGQEVVHGQYLTRLGLSINATDTLAEKLRLSITFGAIVFQALPGQDFWQKFPRNGPGISLAEAEYAFTPRLSLEMGFFPLKYGPSNDLGEYLLRTESYPTMLTTGGWTFVDSAYDRALGFRVKSDLFGGKFHHELGLYLDYTMSPFYDASPAYLFAWRPSQGIEIGGGLALRRWFALNNVRDTGFDASAEAAQYVTIRNFPEVQNQADVYYTYDNGSGKRVQGRSFAVWGVGGQLDTAALLAGKPGATVSQVQMLQQGSTAGSRTGIKKLLRNLSSCTADSVCSTYMDNRTNTDSVVALGPDGKPTGDRSLAQVQHLRDITRKAINLMGHITLDFGKMLDVEKSTGPFRLYSEIAVLGTQNQDVFYQDITQRMPIMAGLNIPTFGILDVLAVETEYLNNPYPDSDMLLSGYRLAPLRGSAVAVPDVDWRQRNFSQPSVHNDDWKWCFYAVKTLTPGLRLRLQAANDHLRVPYFDVDALNGAAFGNISAKPQTAARGEWYYIAHIEWGL
jgi:hypothetical protein